MVVAAEKALQCKLYSVHRLDKMTSGLLLLAKSPQIAAQLTALFTTHQIQKYYLAISDKKPKKKQGLIKGGMQKSRRGMWKLTKEKNNLAITQFFSYSLGNGKRLFVIKPHSGKTHQIRVALKSIGSAICERFAREGAQVIAADLSQPGTLSEPVEYVAYDVTDEKLCQSTFAELAGRWDKLDILVNAAGIEIEKTIEDTTLEEWNRIFAINVTGMFLTSKFALPLLRKSEGASVINFGSYDGYIADPGLAAYCATHSMVSEKTADQRPASSRTCA